MQTYGIPWYQAVLSLDFAKDHQKLWEIGIWLYDRIVISTDSKIHINV